ncbi:GNAT family protein [Leucobacter albus]|uniref:GNAT family protein n=1 Tax=Leucobacter albus TaxID=272210 RepID=A0ABW3TNU5_9MICO
MRENEYGQPIGEAVALQLPAPRPERVTLTGGYCQLEPLDAAVHAPALFAAYGAAGDGRDWTYLSVGPFATEAEYAGWAATASQQQDPLHFAVVERASGRPLGTLALLRQQPEHAVIEVGFVVFSPEMQRTVMSTEAHFLLMRYAFETLGYRRYEWKCDSLNQPSRRAAERLGFAYEGTFRNAVVYKGRSRDTSWFSIVAAEWPDMRRGFERWLTRDNFDADGGQLSPLRVRG